MPARSEAGRQADGNTDSNTKVKSSEQECPLHTPNTCAGLLQAFYQIQIGEGADVAVDVGLGVEG
jgi:hypothetical protein